MFSSNKSFSLLLVLSIGLWGVVPQAGLAQWQGNYPGVAPAAGFGPSYGLGGSGGFGGAMNSPGGGSGLYGNSVNAGGFSGSGLRTNSGGRGSFLGSSAGFRPSNLYGGLVNRSPASFSGSDPYLGAQGGAGSVGAYSGFSPYGNLNVGGQGFSAMGTYNGAPGPIGNRPGAMFGMPQPGYASLANSIPSATGSLGISYSAGLEFSPEIQNPPVSQAATLARLRDVLVKSSTLPSGRNISLAMDSSTLILRGKVTSSRDKEVLEALVRLEPGIDEVRNEIEVVVGSAKLEKK